MFKFGYNIFDRLASHGFAAIVPATKLVPIQKDDNEPLPDGPCRAIWAGEDGTVNMVLIDGTEITGFPLFAGMNAIGCAQVKTGGTSVSLWAIYD